MNDFKQKIQVDEEIKTALEGISKIYQKQGRVFDEENQEKTAKYLKYLDKKIGEER